MPGTDHKRCVQALRTMIDENLINGSKHSEWDFSNKILYEMCHKNFEHKRIDIVIGKVLMIGRIYSAAIERRKNKGSEKNDQFYVNMVGPKFKNSKIDFYLNNLKKINKLSENTILEILETHLYLTNLINDLTEQNKRSFASKYLHFHLPELYFIYDTRAVKALRLLDIRLSKQERTRLDSGKID